MSTETEKTDQPEATNVVAKEATVWELATIIAGSRDFPTCRTPEKAAVRILAGKEMGVPPIASVIGIRVDAGRVSMDATLMASCIERSDKYSYSVVAHDETHCVLSFKKDGLDCGQSSFSMADAEKACLHKKDTWKNYPRNMLFARALSNGARWYCAGIFGGSVYTHDELGIVTDADGHAVEPDGGYELCTRDQRQEITRLVAAFGESMPDYLGKLGVKLLDELTGAEADRELKKLTRKAEKSSTAGTTATTAPKPPQSALTPAQQTLAEATVEAAMPSTPEQKQRILELAAVLVPDEGECYEMLLAALARRGKQRIADLDHLQAAALIETIEGKIKEAKEPPFDPAPEAGK